MAAGRRSAVPGPPYIVTALLLTTLLILLVAHQSSTVHLDKIRDTRLAQYIQQKLPGSDKYESGRTSYYSQDGMLQVDRSVKALHRQARFLPYSLWEDLENQGKTGLEADVRLGDGFDLLEDWTQALKDKDYREAAVQDGTFDFIRDKTILILGDSVDRNAIGGFCKRVGGKVEVRQFSNGEDLTQLSNDDHGDPHRCQLPAFAGNATVWSFMIYGSMGNDEVFELNLPKNRPKDIMSRLRLIAERLNNHGIAPDFILMAQQQWDLLANNLERARHNLPAKDALDLSFLGRVRRQLYQTMDLTQELFPNAKKMFRILHHSRTDVGMWWGKIVPPESKNIQRAPYSANKGEQLNVIVRNVISQYGVLPFDLRHVLQGHRLDFLDAIHPGPVGETMYTQMLLYQIKHLS